MEIAVFCASAEGLDESFKADARALGRGLVRLGFRLIYGGGNVGLMGEVARTVHESGGYVAGYIPERLMAIEGRAYAIADELIVTETMDERKTSIFDRSDAYITLPGGLGTIEEFMEIVTLRKLGYHDKPIVLVNPSGFWDRFLDFLYETTYNGFSPDIAPLFDVAPDSDSALELLAERLGASTTHPS